MANQARTPTLAAPDITRRIARKELGLFFSSPVAWMFLASFAAVSLFIFFWVEAFFARNVADVRPLFEWMPLLLIFLCSAISMRTWSEERRSGTLEHVLTQPVSLWNFVRGKFRACLALLALALLATVPLPLTVSLIGELDWGPVAAGYLAALLLGSAYLSIGLFISSRTDNPIVSLIGSVCVCSILYLLGSNAITSFVNNPVGDVLRLMGSGSRFDSIVRGVIDGRDLLYYLSLTAGFLALNVYSLEQERWALSVSTSRHRLARTATALLLINLLALNVWMHKLPGVRLDITRGQIYSLSDTSIKMLQQLDEPLLLRGYFSAQTHPLLSPLVAQLHDLMKEYEIASDGRLRLQWLDPADDPLLEQEANQHYGINATPFQVADRHKATLVNSYFDIVVQYGDEFTTLSYTDLVEVRAATGAAGTGHSPDVRLRNPEFDITQAIRDVLNNYRSGGNLFEGINKPVELIAYVSADDALPQPLQRYKQAVAEQARQMALHSGGKFSLRFIEPEARDGMVARQIADEWGFTPMLAGLGDQQPFYFYLTLADDRQVVQLPTGQFQADQFRPALEAGLKRFSTGFTKTVALAIPAVNPDMARFNMGGPTFTHLERVITEDYRLLMEDLSDGMVSPEADILVLAAPHRLDEKAIYAIDQFLMRGATVVLASSPFTAEQLEGELQLQDWPSGLEEWLQHHGVDIEEAVVMDSKNTPFSAPVARQSGEYQFRDVQLVDYPYFIDLRPPQLAAGHSATGSVPQVTMAWASPVALAPGTGRRTDILLRSSSRAWLSTSMDVMPRADANGLPSFDKAQSRQSYTLGVSSQGRFHSWFNQRELPVLAAERDGSGVPIESAILHSPESARLVVYASNDFLDDQILRSVAATSNSAYLGSIELILNTLDWALQDELLMNIRARGHINRTLLPIDKQTQANIEYANYALAIAWLLLLAIIHLVHRYLKRRRYARELSL
jgi:gliding motility-associated transport system permease protein/gliding motility-associatede transport system auxiliary component